VLNASAHLGKKSLRWPTHGIYEQRPIEEEVAGFAACLGDDETAMAGGTMEAPIIGCGHAIMMKHAALLQHAAPDVAAPVAKPTPLHKPQLTRAG
jgi:hypothetical protein